VSLRAEKSITLGSSKGEEDEGSENDEVFHEDFQSGIN